MIEYDKFRSSLKRLQEQYVNYQGTDNLRLDSIMREAVAESVIHRFEICYDCLWKVLRRYLTEELGVANAPNSPKPVFRLAFENNILSSPIEKWIDYANSRINTSHDYDEGKARRCLGIVSDFIDDAVDIYETMSRKSWNR
ncbi:MAG: HI0074 family nucleotidyltransferase substrate-binding subunit [Candidatus Dadabacteria bacterium]|nr:HI0074 family nucleotidyltransferase substrate-binding subunit [Candidatus Dadabacteria bacterium]MCY4262085.1 HI0074 family nucleotidyltransferase substrate-binding subunit [Candidatus Dadabacteria bacterium]